MEIIHFHISTRKNIFFLVLIHVLISNDNAFKMCHLHSSQLLQYSVS